MSRLLDLVRRVVRQELGQRRGARLAVVVAVHPHEAEDDDANYEADVRLKHEELELTRVPIATHHMGFAAPPRVGDLVLVEFLDGDLNQPLVTSRFYHDEERVPLHRENEFLVEHRLADGTLNHLRFADDGTIHLARDVTRPEDTSEARATITIDGESAAIEVRNGENACRVSEDGIRLEDSSGNLVEMTADDFRLTAKVPFTLDASGQPVEIIGSTIDLNKG